MTIWDDRILEYIEQEGSGAPTELAESGYVRVSRQHVSRRMQKLADHGLLQHLGNGVYIITDAGSSYLTGDHDAGESLERSDEAAGETGRSDQPG
ncbi:MAG: ArsR family transcriptional regulator [Natrialbaceae archaeon]|nr:ArsR family transcriptional regulator [Natrialbaceae archaeon]